MKVLLTLDGVQCDEEADRRFRKARVVQMQQDMARTDDVVAHLHTVMDGYGVPRQTKATVK